MRNILNVSNHPIDLDDGRTLAPSETAEVNLDLPHNSLLTSQGLALALENETPATPAAASRKGTNS